MPVYAYIASGGRATQRGTVTADSPRQARDQLRAQGLRVRDLAEHRSGRSGGTLWQRYLVRRQAGQVTGLLQEVATLLGAGIPLLDALDTITRQHAGRLRQSMLLLRERVAGGSSLADAMAAQPGLFDDLCVNIVQVGENAGTLDVALVRLVDFRRRTATWKNRVASTLMYPCIVLCVGVIASIFLMTYVLPNLLSVLADSGKKLPLATMAIKSVSDLLLGWWWALLLGLAAVIGGTATLLRSERGRMAWHRLQLRIPLLGELIRKQAIARMSMVMAALLKSDVAFTQAARIAQRTVRNRVLSHALTACEWAVTAGTDIAVALEQTAAFPPLVIQIFAVGQASGRLETMLENLAADYDTQVEIVSGRLTALLEPVMIVFLAVVVGFIAFATILPILEAGNVL